METPVPRHPASELRTCNSCSARVHRDEVHKNRYGQYICKACRRDGVRAVGRRRLQHLVKRMPTALVTILVTMLVITAGTVAVVVLMKAHAYSNAGMVDDLKSLVRSINRMAR